ncbi:YggS family pyridoxal phosphate-dependent enzyme [Haloechinothrix sp. LS1_15]|uniref:YggS family pyridoxal phosphate-dependent enzyme n=1 Tax=Haloechinothrix sp. LS1_15 TaxID=2652248 RepID=UPI002947CF4D|nr:YggS family pyridoxal phosphate-dependent enzyme [Haloechinothrix sp. LS1_15]MDV6013468.1 YggS family pyridoxal phosphate-dependent enzyme [Haloechinothrix sp. LS1_15]
MQDAERVEQLRRSLDALRARVTAACESAGRDPEGVRLVAVTKTFPASDAALLSDLGVRHFAENKDQEAGAKVAEFTRLRPDADVRWHMVGRMQRNKARTVVRWADEVQSVDSPRLVNALEQAAARAREKGWRSRPLDVLVQVSLDEAPHRGGCSPAMLPELVSNITRSDEMRFRGLMTVAPQGVDHDSAFARFADIARWLREDYPNLVELSAGMSGDLESAIAHGSTCVRVGTALLGGRELASRE